MKVFIVVNEGEIVFASKDSELAQGYCDDANMQGTEEEVEESGRDIEDLTDSELAEFSFMSGYNGGYHYCEEIVLDDNADDDSVYTTSEGDEFTKSEILEAIESSDVSNIDFDFDDEIDFGNIDNTEDDTFNEDECDIIGDDSDSGNYNIAWDSLDFDNL